METLETRLRKIEAIFREIREEHGYENVVLQTRCGCRREISIATGNQFIYIPLFNRFDINAHSSPPRCDRRFSYRYAKLDGKRIFEED